MCKYKIEGTRPYYRDMSVVFIYEILFLSDKSIRKKLEFEWRGTMAISNIKATFPYDIKKVWDIVTYLIIVYRGG